MTTDQSFQWKNDFQKESSILTNYKNGDFEVTIFNDGTKYRSLLSDNITNPIIVYPETIDVKITDYCDLGCPMCHESSTIKGKHGNVIEFLELITEFPINGIEFAIGGGNPLNHPNLVDLMIELKNKNHIPNLTINQGHILPYWNLIETILSNNMIYGLGVSITSNNFNVLSKIASYKDVVFHVILGIHDYTIIETLNSHFPNCKILVLGYKQFGFGKLYWTQEIQDSISVWYRTIAKYIQCGYNLSFDNLAIDQLKLKRLFVDSWWEEYYMGDDFMFSMYVDAVKKEYAPTSRSQYRIAWSDMSLLTFFQTKPVSMETNML